MVEHCEFKFAELRSKQGRRPIRMRESYELLTVMTPHGNNSPHVKNSI